MNTSKIPADNSLVQLATTLAQATRNGKISWKSLSPTEYTYSNGETTVVIRSLENDGLEPYEFVLIDSQGAVVEAYETVLEEDAWGQQARLAGDAEFVNLFAVARRNALKIDQIIGSLMKSLSDEPPF